MAQLLALAEGLLDPLPLGRIGRLREEIRRLLAPGDAPGETLLARKPASGDALDGPLREALLSANRNIETRLNDLTGLEHRLRQDTVTTELADLALTARA